MPTTATSKQANEIRKRQQDELLLADRILAANVPGIPADVIARTDSPTFRRFFSEDDWLVLAELVKPPLTIASEIQRMAGVLKFSAIAGNKADRAKADAELKSALKARDAKVPALEKSILAMQAEVRELQDAARKRQANVDSRSTARDILRKKVPPAHLDLHNRRSKELKQTHFELTEADEAELLSILSAYDDGIPS